MGHGLLVRLPTRHASLASLAPHHPVPPALGARPHGRPGARPDGGDRRADELRGGDHRLRGPRPGHRGRQRSPAAGARGAGGPDRGAAPRLDRDCPRPGGRPGPKRLRPLPAGPGERRPAGRRLCRSPGWHGAGPVAARSCLRDGARAAPLAPDPGRRTGLGPHDHGGLRAGPPPLPRHRPLSALAADSSLADLAEAEPVAAGPAALVVPARGGGHLAPARLSRDRALGADLVLWLGQGRRDLVADRVGAQGRRGAASPGRPQGA